MSIQACFAGKPKRGTAERDASIHPRVVDGRTAHAKVNTSKKPDPAVAARKAANVAAHEERQSELRRGAGKRGH